MSGDDRGPNYHAFLLRLWRDRVGGLWHASLQTPDGVERRGFAGLEDLIAFLRQLLEPAAAPDPRGDATEGDDPVSGPGR